MKSKELSEVIINGTGGCEGQKRGSLWPLIDKACKNTELPGPLSGY